jgi:sulfate adenylyltransferase subunit 1
LQQGIVAIVDSNLSAADAALIRRTGVIALVNADLPTDLLVTASTLDEAVEQIVEFVRL